MNPDKFYDYRRFDDDRLEGIMTGWDGLRGNHGLVIKLCADLLVGDTALDVGCGLCHLYEAFKSRVACYVGVDLDIRVLEWARKRHPELEFRQANVYDLSTLGNEKFDTVFAIGLYRRLNQSRGVEEMLKHTRHALVLTYFHASGASPRLFPDVLWRILKNKAVSKLEFFNHGIKGIEVVRLNIDNS